ncbi:5-formyltetrahydrofolate cyclo-ligase [Domibacillus epiphyticus]|uniref:5-formyltetrahydrofolate cyclo-ligase n=1 Tax=Domibacillus epiphyticus TaxID=1714355 RepID=A0A1V2A9K5_9BACI|nr:5-formyltetrahydrofolate cyclo-ligase [Domibacillus epiphyticus]OMP67678.1 5-formyltetrahydrofolate cyclo-ligase [Domibacillus epiphyticus]
MNKKQMRIEIKAQLSALEKPEYEQRCYLIAQRLYTLSEWKAADTIAITVSAPFEVDTWAIIRQAWMSEKKVCVPKCLPETKEMKFYMLSDFLELEKVYAGLYEPSPCKTKLVPCDKIDLVVVPGLLFNKKGYRIGFGGGYYDRFLAGYKGDTVSLACSFQLRDTVPIELHDFPVQKIVTDSCIINCSN